MTISRTILLVLPVLLFSGCGKKESAEQNQTETTAQETARYRTGAEQVGPVATSLTERREASRAKQPTDRKSVMVSFNENLAQSGILEKALKVGDTIPSFNLENALGSRINSADLLAQGPMVLVFYRGSWCPYCNLYLQSLQDSLSGIKAAGGTLVAVTPEYPDESITTVEKHGLEFEVLSDPGLKTARQFGLVYEFTPALDSVYAGFGLNLREHNRTEKSELPIPATYVIDRSGRIVYAFLDTDYTYRAEPSEVIAALRKLQS